jgi:crotonobetainyl-CoA:carnitine CoA-transferase CaiB-like acyl-CoA transferase
MSEQSILHNVRVLDFTWVLAGPFATRLLADFGAEVIKVQPRLSAESDDAFSRGYYAAWNRNKLGITLDLSQPEGIGLAKKLVGVCDVVAESFAPRVMANWGLDYAHLQKIKPDIIMVSLSLMGHSGPFRDYSGFGPAAHAFSGLTSLTGFPGGPPLGPGFSFADHVAGLYASLAVLGALEERLKTGCGQYIDISEVAAVKSLLGGGAMRPEGNRSGEAAPHGVYACRGRDRWCAISVSTESEWRGLKKALGNPPWADDKKFASLSGRIENAYALDDLISQWTRKHTAAEVMAALQSYGVPSGVVQDAAGLALDPQLRARGFFVDRPDVGKLVDAAPLGLLESPAAYYRPAPPPGRDNAYVYGKLLGLTEKEIAELRKKGVI